MRLARAFILASLLRSQLGCGAAEARPGPWVLQASRWLSANWELGEMSRLGVTR